MTPTRPESPIAVPWPKSLATRLSLATIIIVIAALVVTGTGLIAIAYFTEQQTLYRLQEVHADEVALLISGLIGDAQDELQLFEDIIPLSTMTRAEQQEYLEDLLVSRQMHLSQVALLDRAGYEQVRLSRFHTYLPGELMNRAGTPAFLAAMNRSTYISPVYISPDSGLLSIEVALPVTAKNDDIRGVLVSEVNIVQLWQEVSRARNGETGYAYLVDGKGRFIAYQDSAAVLKNYGRDMTAMPPVADFVAGRPAASRQVYEYQGLTGENVIGVSAPIKGTGWAVVTELPTREAYAGITRMLYYLETLIVVSVIMGGVLVLAVSRRIIRPIQALTVTAQRMGAGDLDAEVIEVLREDEVGALARTFSHMQGELRGLYQGLEQQVEELRVAHETLVRKNDELNRANRELAVTQDQLREHFSELQRKERELKFANTVLLTQQETSFHGILVVDEERKIISWNQRFAELWGIPPDLIASRSDVRTLEMARTRVIDADEFVRKVNYLYEHRYEKSQDEIRLTDGVTLERYSSPMIGKDGMYYGRVWYFLDITARRQAEEEILRKTEELRRAYEQLARTEEELRDNFDQLARSQQALSQARTKLNVLNTVTFQDIQNAIFSLHGFLELERGRAADEPTQKYLERQRRIIQKITGSLRFATQYQNLGLNPPRWQNIEQIFLYGISHLDFSRFSREIRVSGLEIYADPLLETVFFTLAENVVLHGGTATHISLSCRETPDGLVLVFEDNGDGIPAEMKEKMFDRQYEEKKDMGLFLAREILSVTGITIRESGEPGRGARFEMTVPPGGYRFPENR